MCGNIQESSVYIWSTGDSYLEYFATRLTDSDVDPYQLDADPEKMDST